MQTHCIRRGQIEVGIIVHEGHQFAALGATKRNEIASFMRLRRGS